MAKARASVAALQKRIDAADERARRASAKAELERARVNASGTHQVVTNYTDKGLVTKVVPIKK
jgi:hypothetical protein